MFGALGEKVTLKKSKIVNLQLEDGESRQTPCRTGPAAGPEALTPTHATTTTTRKGLEPYTEKLDLYLEARGSQNVILEPAVGASPGNLIEIQILGTTLDPVNQ